jgi:two-component system phosphate regulon sensor histidine kinase PhoR
LDNSWSKPTLILGVIGAAGMIALAAFAPAVLVPAAAGAVLFFGIALYLSAPSNPKALEVPARHEVNAPQAMPDAAKALLDTIDEPIIVFDGAGRVQFANKASRPLVGADVDRKHVTAVLRYPEILEGVERVLAGGDAESIALTIMVPVERHYRARVARGKVEGPGLVILHFNDLTSLRRAEEMRADFVANASHELRTPLAAVSGFIDTLRGHARNDEEARERFLEIMSVETARMRRLIDDLLSLTRIELNEHNPPMGKVDLVGIVRDAAAALLPLAEADEVKLEIGTSEPLWATGDRDELIQVFQNLIHNAIKYGGESGTVHIAFGTSPGGGRNTPPQVFASIRDEGEGIPRESIPRLTERFYRVDVKRSRERGGTGLGLAIVKHILNRHNGKLQIDSILGVGSTFVVYLPADLATAAEKAEPSKPAIRRAS